MLTLLLLLLLLLTSRPARPACLVFTRLVAVDASRDEKHPFLWKQLLLPLSLFSPSGPAMNLCQFLRGAFLLHLSRLNN